MNAMIARKKMVSMMKVVCQLLIKQANERVYVLPAEPESGGPPEPSSRRVELSRLLSEPSRRSIPSVRSAEPVLGSMDSSVELSPEGTATLLVYESQSTLLAAAGIVVVGRAEEEDIVRWRRERTVRERRGGQALSQEGVLRYSRAKIQLVRQTLFCLTDKRQRWTVRRAVWRLGRFCKNSLLQGCAVGNPQAKDVRSTEACYCYAMSSTIPAQCKLALASNRLQCFD
jgi:hypothetical protein